MRLYCVFIKSEYLDVGSGKNLSAANQPLIILIFTNLGVLCDGVVFVIKVYFECVFD